MELSTPDLSAAAASGDPLPSPSGKRAAVFRLVCPADRAAAALGRGGASLRRIRDATGASVRVDDAPCSPGGDRVVVVSGDAACAGEDALSAAQRAAVRVWERVVGRRVGEEGEEEREREVSGAVACRMLVAGSHVGCVLGKGGKTIERMRQESGAHIRVFHKEQVPPCAAPGDELINISGSFSAVRKALLLVSSCLQDRQDVTNIMPTRSFGPPGSGVGSPASMDPYSQRSYLPSPRIPAYHGRSYSSSNVTASSPRFFEQEVLFRMLCANDKVGSIIGKAGITIRTLQSETGASIKVVDPIADSDERIVVISACENSEMMHSPVQEAVLRVHSRIWEAGMDKNSAVSARLLVPAQQIGCLLGKGGSIIAEMRKVTGASIRIFVKEQVPKCAQPNDELVQVTGSFRSVQDALRHITGRIRDTIIPIKPHTGGGVPQHPSVVDTPLHRLRQDANPPGPFSTAGHSFRADPTVGLSDTTHMTNHQPPPSQSMEHFGIDRLSHFHGSETAGPRPFVEQPSPRTRTPEVSNRGSPSEVPDMATGFDVRKGVPASENQVAAPTSMTTEVIIPQEYLGFICGANGSDLAEIRKMSGAFLTVHDPKTGETAGTVTIRGDPDQTKTAQSLLHAFIFCGLYLN